MHMIKGTKFQLCLRSLENLRWILTREYWRNREGSLEQTQAEPGDFVDLAARTYTRDFLLSLSEIERERLFMIEDALARIREGTYGVCSQCEAPIPGSRLEAVPETTFCLDCQEVSEEALLAKKSAVEWPRTGDHRAA